MNLYISSFEEEHIYEPETRPICTDSDDTVWSDITQGYLTSNQATIWRWRDAFQNDIAEHMDWSIANYFGAGQNLIGVLNGDKPLQITGITPTTDLFPSEAMMGLRILMEFY